MTTPDYAAIEAACKAVLTLAEELSTTDRQKQSRDLARARPYILAAAQTARERDELRAARDDAITTLIKLAARLEVYQTDRGDNDLNSVLEGIEDIMRAHGNPMIDLLLERKPR